MKWGEGTVFVLGAGFTKSFIPSAPLLVDDYHVDELIKKYDAFKEACELLEMEIRLTESEGYRKGCINLERLMTRIVSGMPYDYRAGANLSFLPLLSDLKKAFVSKLSTARQSVKDIPGDLSLFAQHCVSNSIHCITFNYDDLLDEALWDDKDISFKGDWNPDEGYGFPCISADSITNPAIGIICSSTSNLLLKLHGSINWRLPFGLQPPFPPHIIRHHEGWFKPEILRPKKLLKSVERLLDPDPLLVPPVLSKSELTEQPVLKLIWSIALEKLKIAKRVVFMGYSLPITDIAASYLFREGLRQLDQREITVVDFASDEKQNEKLNQLLPTYKKVFPSIDHAQFRFCGADSWIRNNLTEWLFDSKGQPVAFLANGHVISKTGNYVGNIRGHLKRTDVWHGRYKGDIIDGNRFLRDRAVQKEDRGGMPPPPLPSVPTIPKDIEPIALPKGYQDIDWTDEANIYAQPAGMSDN